MSPANAFNLGAGTVSQLRVFCCSSEDESWFPVPKLSRSQHSETAGGADPVHRVMAGVRGPHRVMIRTPALQVEELFGKDLEVEPC